MKKILRLGLVFLLGLAAVSSLPTSSYADQMIVNTPVDVEKLTDNTFDDFGPSIFVDSVGKVHVAWAAGSDYRSDMSLYYCYKSATGWEIEQVPKVPNSMVNVRPSLFVDSSGKPHIAWISNPTPQPPAGLWYGWNVWYAVKDGGVWVMEQVTNWGSENHFVRLVLDSSDNPHIAWDARYYYGLWGVHYATKVGGTWAIEIVDNADDAGPSLFVDSNNVPHMFWLHIHYGLFQPEYAVKIGGTWTKEIIQSLSGAGHGDGQRQLFVDQSGVPHIALSRQIQSSPVKKDELWYGDKTDGSWAFSQIGDSSFSNLWPSIFLDSSGNPYVAWMSNAVGDYNPYVATMQEGSWNIVQVDDNPINDYEPSFFVDSQDNVHLAWFAPYIGSGEAEIYYTHMPSAPPRKLAVVIGIKDYKGAGGKAALGAVNDANNVYSLLINVLGFSEENVHLLTDDQGLQDDLSGSRTAILQELAWLAEEAQANDIVVFYISCHGARGKGGEPEYIQPHSGDDISDDTLKEKIDDISSNRIAVIMDLCFSGGFIYDDDQESDLAQGTPADRIVLTACSESEFSWAAIYSWFPPKMESVFTHYFVHAFTTSPISGRPFGDANGDGNVSIEEAFEYILISIFFSEYTRQRPQMYDGISGDFYLGDI